MNFDEEVIYNPANLTNIREENGSIKLYKTLSMKKAVHFAYENTKV